jgi:hypothetical protein
MKYMRKLVITFLLTTILIAARAQDGDLKKVNYLRLGFSLPTWKYYGWDDKSDWDDNTKRIGGMLEAGSIYILNGIKIADGMRLGINVDYLSMTYHLLRETDRNYGYHFMYLGSKVGPSFSYSPTDRLVLNAYFKLNPVWVAGSMWLFNDDNMDDRIYIGFMGIKYSVGFDIRYSMAMLGFEFNPGFVKFREYNTDENKLTDHYLGNINAGDKTPVPCINLTLGLGF